MANRINYFLPYLRQGVTTLAPHDQVAGKRMVIPVKLTITASNKIDNSSKNDIVGKEIILYGPGDVLGINENIIARLAPALNTNNFESALTPFIEFAEPDFLWRFSSLQTADKKNWVPWLALLILKSEDEYEKVPPANKTLPPQIQLKPNAVLPDLKESWRWAHVHKMDIAGSSAAQIIDSIKTAPEKVVCRLLSPRKLQPQTKYHAFLVPAFKIGAEAAMGITNGTGDRTLLTWATPAAGAGTIIPYYYDWEFTTGTKGGFEYLVRKLKPTDLEKMGTRTIDCSNPGYGMGEVKLGLQMEAALKSLDINYQPWGMDSANEPDSLSKKKQVAMATLLNMREEKIKKENGEIETRLRVTPPVYGEWYASVDGETVKVNAENRNHWLEELNLDFRHRAAAGLGVQFIKENQENLMKAAWEQLSTIKKVNQELNLGRFGREVSACMYQRLNQMKPTNLFKIALPVQNKIEYQPAKTIGAFLNNSAITNNLTRTKAKKYLFKMSGAGNGQDFKPVETTTLVSTGFRVNGTKGRKGIDAAVRPAKLSATSMSIWPDEMLNKTKAALDPKITIESGIKKRVSRFRSIEETKISRNGNLQNTQEDQLRPVKWYPEFHRPMYHFLRALSQEYILPGLENVAQNTVGLLQTNRRFIEAFMVGLNHEMASELRWREFPTDLRGSYFRSFWDTSIYSVDDNEKIQFRSTSIGLQLLEDVKAKNGSSFATFPAIEALYIKANPDGIEKEIADAYENAMEKWLLTREEDKDIDALAHWEKAKRLGDHPVPGKWNNQEEDQNQIVLLIRGELLQKFSNTLIYLVGKKPDGKPDVDPAGRRTYPVFEGTLPPDIVFIGFPIKIAEVAGYFVVFEERITELRFGLDETPEGSVPGTGENDFSWEHFPTLTPDGYLDGIPPTIFTQQWNNPAFISKVMMQKQVRAAIELKTLLPGNQ